MRLTLTWAQSIPRHWLTGCLFIGALWPMTAIHASNSDNNSIATTKQPAIKWYRYYNNKGEPSLSSTISPEQMNHGYETLDRNMQVINHYPAFSQATYEHNKAQRDAASQQDQDDIKLKRGYGSAAQATLRRDRELNELANHQEYLQHQLDGLQIKQKQNDAQASHFEQKKKPIPPYLRNNISEVNRNVASLQQNITTVTIQEQQTKAQFNAVIKRLTQLEQQNKH